MAYSELPKLKKNSVSTTIASPGINDTDTTIPVTELAVFYDADSNLITKGIVIGYDNATETYAEEITITGASGTSGAGNLTGATRGVNADGTIGAAKAHIATTNIAVMFSTGIYENIRDNQIAIEANTRQILTANTAYYVATTGSDVTGDGTSGNPWATIQHAYDYIVANLDIAGHTVIIQVADGTYTSGISLNSPWIGGGSIYIIGNTTTYSNCIISAITPIYGVASFPAPIHIQGFKLLGATTAMVQHDGNGAIYLNHIEFGSSSAYGILTQKNNAIIHMSGASYIVSASPQIFVNVGGGSVLLNSSHVTLVGTPAFTTYLYASGSGSKIVINSATIVSGSATGSYYSIVLNASLARYSAPIPGDTAGTTSTGGQYI